MRTKKKTNKQANASLCFW